MTDRTGPLCAGDPRDGFRYVVHQAGIAGACQIAGVALRLGTALLVARLLGTVGLGLYILALTLANGATVVATLGLDRTATRFIAHHRGRDEPGEAFGIFVFSSLCSAGVAVVAATLLFLGAPQLAHWLHRPELAEVSRIVAVAVPFLAIGYTSRAGLCGFQDVRLAAGLEHVLVPSLTVVVLVLVAWWRPDDPATAVYAAAVAQSAVGIASLLALYGRFRPGHPVASVHAGPWLRFSLPMWAERAMLFVVGSAGYVALARFSDTETVAVYAVSVRLAGVISLPLQAASSIIGPTVADLTGRREPAALQELYARLTRSLFVVGAGLGLVVVAFGGPALRTFGAEFAAGYGALTILAASQVVNSGTGPSGLVLIMTGRAGLRLANATAGAVSTVSLSLLLVPRWGALGAAIAVAASASVLNVVQVLQVRWLLGLSAYDTGGGRVGGA